VTGEGDFDPAHQLKSATAAYCQRGVVPDHRQQSGGDERYGKLRHIH